MSAASVIPAGGGEVVGDAPDRRVEILCEHDALHATWARFGPRREGADPHVHRLHSDFFYVLDGELTAPARAGAGRTWPCRRGRWRGCRRSSSTGSATTSDAEVRYLNFHAPGVGFADYMRALRDGGPRAYDQYEPPPDGGRPAAEAAFSRGPGPLADTGDITIAEATAARAAGPAPGGCTCSRASWP